MSVELGLVTAGAVAVAFLLKIAFNMGGEEEGEEGHDVFRLFYFGLAHFFTVGTVGIGGRIAASNGYQRVADMLYGMASLLVVLTLFLFIYIYVVVLKRGSEMAIRKDPLGDA